MSRKNLFPERMAATSPAPAAAPASLTPASAPLQNLSKVLMSVRDRAGSAETLEKMLAAGQRIVEIDPATIDPSPIGDRLPASAEEDASLRDSLEAQGQQVPVLLRPHPTEKGRYLTVYGHRRVAALRGLGRKVRACVAELDAAAAYVAQGVENAERRDLSFIERALFARRLSEAGVAQQAIAAALATARPNVSAMTQVARRLPEELIRAIGRAPRLGQPRWEQLARTLEEGEARMAWKAVVAAPDFAGLDDEAKFARVLTAVAARKGGAPADRPAPRPLADAQGKTFAVLERAGRGAARLKLQEEAFADWLADRLPELRAAWRREG